MKIRLLKLNEQKQYFDEILRMLIQADDEFVPPLSSRNSTTQSKLNDVHKNKDGVLYYFERLKEQRLMIAEENGTLMGFVSFKENYINNEITACDIPNIYISTLIVRQDARGKGLTKAMYEILFKEYKNVDIFTRTWSTNYAHTKILSNFGFEVLSVLKDDRGNGIDTVYFLKKH